MSRLVDVDIPAEFGEDDYLQEIGDYERYYDEVLAEFEESK